MEEKVKKLIKELEEEVKEINHGIAITGFRSDTRYVQHGLVHQAKTMAMVARRMKQELL